MILDNICLLLCLALLIGYCALLSQTEYDYDERYDTNGNKLDFETGSLTNNESNNTTAPIEQIVIKKDDGVINKLDKSNKVNCPICRSDINYNIFKDSSSDKSTKLPWDANLNECKIKRNTLADSDLYPNFAFNKNTIIMA